MEVRCYSVELPDENDAQLTLRTWASQIERAQQLAKEIRQLPRYELLGITKMTVLRLALADGVEVIERVDRKYLREEEAQRLRDEINRGTVVGGVHLPYINGMNVMLTPTPYSDTIFTAGIVDLHRRRLGQGKEVLINIRLPKTLRQRLDSAVREILAAGPPPERETASAAVRLVLEIGLFWIGYKVYWLQNGHHDGRPESEPPGGPIIP
jgi:hypothetical protein